MVGLDPGHPVRTSTVVMAGHLSRPPSSPRVCVVERVIRRATDVRALGGRLKWPAMTFFLFVVVATANLRRSVGRRSPAFSSNRFRRRVGKRGSMATKAEGGGRARRRHLPLPRVRPRNLPSLPIVRPDGATIADRAGHRTDRRRTRPSGVGHLIAFGLIEHPRPRGRAASWKLAARSLMKCCGPGQRFDRPPHWLTEVAILVDCDWIVAIAFDQRLRAAAIADAPARHRNRPSSSRSPVSVRG